MRLTVALRTNILLLYKNAANMTDFILRMEEAKKKVKRAELPILDIDLAMYAATSVLQSGVGGPLIILAKNKFAPNAIFRVVSC